MKDIEKPKSPENVAESGMSTQEGDPMENMDVAADSQEPWPEHFTTTLSAFLSPEKVLDVKRIYLEGLSATPTESSGATRNKGRRQKGSQDVQDDNRKVISDVSSVPLFS